MKAWLAIFLGMAWGSASVLADAAPWPSDIWAATVGDAEGRTDIITLSEVSKERGKIIEEWRRAKKIPGGDPSVETLIQATHEAINRLIDRKLVVYDFERRGYKLPEAIVAQRMKDWESNNSIAPSSSAFLEEVRAYFREQIINDAMKQKFVGPWKIDPSAQEKALYEDKKAAWLATLRKDAYIKKGF